MLELQATVAGSDALARFYPRARADAGFARVLAEVHATVALHPFSSEERAVRVALALWSIAEGEWYRSPVFEAFARDVLSVGSAELAEVSAAAQRGRRAVQRTLLALVSERRGRARARRLGQMLGEVDPAAAEELRPLLERLR